MNNLETLLQNVGDLNFKRRIKKIINFLDIKEDDLLLDLGCGDGFYTSIINSLYPCTIVAADYDKVLLKKVLHNCSHVEKVELAEVNIEDGLPFKNNSLDKIIFTEVLEHLNNPIPALKEIYRILKPNGKLSLTVPHNNYPLMWDPINWTLEHLGLGHINPKNYLFGGVWAYDHKRLYSVDELLTEVKEAGFSVDTVMGLTHYTLPFNLNLLYIGKQLYTSLPLPKKVVRSMEKFDCSVPVSKPWFIERPFTFAKKIDSKNENCNFVGEESFITLFTGLSKKA